MVFQARLDARTVEHIYTATSPAADQTLSYGYSAADGRLASITAGAAGFTSYKYDYGDLANSHLVQSVTQSTTGYSDQRTYDTQRNWLTSRSTSIGAAVKAQFAYQRDNLGRTTQTTKTGEMFNRYGSGSPGLTTWHGYNDRGELTSEQTKLNGTSTLLTGRDDSNAFDNTGNRTSVTHNAGSIRRDR